MLRFARLLFLFGTKRTQYFTEEKPIKLLYSLIRLHNKVVTACDYNETKTSILHS